MLPAKVWVLTYSHRHGEDISVFATQEAAENARINLADEWWDGEIGDSVPKPADANEMAATYFDTMSERQGESADIEETEVQGTEEPADLAKRMWEAMEKAHVTIVGGFSDLLIVAGFMLGREPEKGS